MASGFSRGLQTVYTKGSSEGKSTIMFVLPKDQKPFQCGLCCVAFDLNRDLVIHIKAHLLTKPFQCGYCKVSYETNLGLTVHVKTHKVFVSVTQDNFSINQNIRCGLQEPGVMNESQCNSWKRDSQNQGLLKVADRKEATSVSSNSFILETESEGELTKCMVETFLSGSETLKPETLRSETKRCEELSSKETRFNSENEKFMTTVVDTTTLPRSDASTPDPHRKGLITKDMEDDSLSRSEMDRLETDIQCLMTKIKDEDSLSTSDVLNAHKSCANSFTDGISYIVEMSAESTNDKDNNDGDNSESLSLGSRERLNDSASREDHTDSNHPIEVTLKKSVRQSELTETTSLPHDLKHILVKQEQNCVENSENALLVKSSFEDTEMLINAKSVDKRTISQDTTASARQTYANSSMLDHRPMKLNDYSCVDAPQIGQHGQNSADRDGRSPRPFVCSICGHGFEKTKHISDHVHRIHKKWKDQNALLLSTSDSWSVDRSAITSSGHVDNDEDHSHSHNALKSFKCEACERAFKFRHHLTRHILTVHHESDLRLFECGVCGHKFKLSHHLKYHFDACHGSGCLRPHECLICGQRFKLVHHLKRHASSCQSVGGSANFSFDLRDSSSLQIEASSHSVEKSGGSSTIDESRKHLRKVGKNRATLCHVCGKSVHNSRALQLHILALHSDVRPYQCNLCTKAYTCKTSLDIHLKTHTKEKPFICEICGRSFATKKTLKYHRHTHTNARPYQCELCKKGFNAHSGLKKHRLMHGEDKRYKCDKCEKKFYTSGLLKRHAVTHTDLRPLSCKKCGKTYRSSSSLKYHMTHTHPS